MQTKKQKQEKALAYWQNELKNNRLVHREFYIKGQIAILERKLTLRAVDPPSALVSVGGWRNSAGN